MKWGERILPLGGFPVMFAAAVSETQGGLDHNFTTVALFVIGIVLAIMGVMMRGWFKHVNDNLDRLWEHMGDEAKAREDRWNALHEQCNRHGERISKIEGRLDTKAKFLNSGIQVLKSEGSE